MTTASTSCSPLTLNDSFQVFVTPTLRDENCAYCDRVRRSRGPGRSADWRGVGTDQKRRRHELHRYGRFVEMKVETNRRRIGRDGTVYPARQSSRSPLLHASMDPRDRDYKQLMTAQVLMQDNLRIMVENQKHFDQRIDKLVSAIGEFVRSRP